MTLFCVISSANTFVLLPQIAIKATFPLILSSLSRSVFFQMKQSHSEIAKNPIRDRQKIERKENKTLRKCPREWLQHKAESVACWQSASFLPSYSTGGRCQTFMLLSKLFFWTLCCQNLHTRVTLLTKCQLVSQQSSKLRSGLTSSASFLRCVWMLKPFC